MSSSRSVEAHDAAVCAGAACPLHGRERLLEMNYSAGKLGWQPPAAGQRSSKTTSSRNCSAVWNGCCSKCCQSASCGTNNRTLHRVFLFPGWPALDELKAAKADTLNVAAKLRSRQEIIAENGRDPADVDAEIEADPYAPDLAASATAIANQPETQDA